MVEEKELFKSEEKMSSADAARLIASVADGVSTGRIELQNGKSVTLAIPKDVEVEIEVEEEGKKRSLEIEIEWNKSEE